MEEADALASSAGIISKKMLAIGTGDYLRNRFDPAYHVHIILKNADTCTPDAVETVKLWVKSTFLEAEVEDKSYHGQIRFSLPVNGREVDGARISMPVHRNCSDFIGLDIISEEQAESSITGRERSRVSAIFAMLEHNKEKLGLEYYSVSPTTLDQVFLTIVGKHNVAEEGYAQDTKRWWMR